MQKINSEVNDSVRKLLKEVQKERELYVWVEDDWDAGYAAALRMIERKLKKILSWD